MNQNIQFTLAFWQDEGWFVGRLKEYPAVMSQGENLRELRENIREAYDLLIEEAKASFEVPAQDEEMVMAL